MAWQHISPELSVKGFECVSIAVCGSDSLTLWNDSEENGDEGEDEGTDCKDIDSDTQHSLVKVDRI
jgi:hypothetical protein